MMVVVYKLESILSAILPFFVGMMLPICIWSYVKEENTKRKWVYLVALIAEIISSVILVLGLAVAGDVSGGLLFTAEIFFLIANSPVLLEVYEDLSEQENPAGDGQENCAEETMVDCITEDKFSR